MNNRKLKRIVKTKFDLLHKNCKLITEVNNDMIPVTAYTKMVDMLKLKTNDPKMIRFVTSFNQTLEEMKRVTNNKKEITITDVKNINNLVLINFNKGIDESL